jgi:methionyl-tRNA synthetase
MTDKKYYITTAISYPNGKPHIGHAYEAVCTDALARFHRLMGRDVRFLTGTDEHGLKMVQTAAKEGISPQELADKNSQYFKDMCAALDVSCDRFIRTTDNDHKAICQALWNRMEANGDIYLAKYEGWYSVRDEAYFGEDELTTGEGGAKFAPSGALVEWTVEETYFFKLSAYKYKLLELYNNQLEFIQPDGRRNEVMRFVEGDLRDLSISRTSFKWGVPVPGDDNHVMYVWIDALTNYLSGVVDADSDLDFDGRVALWENSEITHIIGKDIVRFHAVYWPAFLMSAAIPLSKQVFGHGFLLNRGEKMSKSLGNVVDPMELVERFGADAVRYYFLRKVSFGDDGGFSAEDIAQTYNSDLANSFGNLVQRVFSFIAKNLEGRVPNKSPDWPWRRNAEFNIAPSGSVGVTVTTTNETDGRGPIEPSVDLLLREIPFFSFLSIGAFENLSRLNTWDSWISGVFKGNLFVDTNAPWTLKKTDPVKMEHVLSLLLDAIRTLAIALQPVAPTGAAKALAMFGCIGEVPFSAINDHDWYDRWAASGFIIHPPTPIFPRIEMPKDE